MTTSIKTRKATEIAVVRHLQSLARARDVGVAVEKRTAAERERSVAADELLDLEAEWRAAVSRATFLPELAPAWSAQIRGQSHALARAEDRLRTTQAALLDHRKAWQVALVRETAAQANRDTLERQDRAERDERALKEASDLHLARKRSR
ncbi:hypothetical protein [Flavisphingomonas formosensis]|uniref:hypothetical protein n=1 Tax=Flavisphingomonas formosensis TaxID=861534 RepID=UPI0012FBF008|nr:hypothetical protein [Sphingomonas formosensis]